MGLGSECRISPGVSASELLKLEIVLKLFAWSHQNPCVVVYKKTGWREALTSEIVMRESWRWTFDG